MCGLIACRIEVDPDVCCVFITVSAFYPRLLMTESTTVTHHRAPRSPKGRERWFRQERITFHTIRLTIHKPYTLIHFVEMKVQCALPMVKEKRQSSSMDPPTYWRHRDLPWEEIWGTFCDPHTYVAVKRHNPYIASPPWEHGHRFDSAQAFADWVRGPSAETALGLYIDPPPDRFLVFDFDVRLVTGAHPLGCDHSSGPAAICPTCWPLVNAAVVVLDERVRRLFQLDPGLVVFSGNNGVHVWFPARNRVQQHALSIPGIRKTWILPHLDPSLRTQEGGSKLPRLQENPTPEETARLSTMGLERYASFAHIFDHRPTAEWHSIRLPFSLNENMASRVIGRTDQGLLPWPFDVDPIASLELMRGWAPPLPSRMWHPKRREWRGHSARPMVEFNTLQGQIPTTFGPSLFLRVNELERPGGKSRYGARRCIPLRDLLDYPLSTLQKYSLIIPSVTERRDIPSKRENQGAFNSMWHLRYFGYLDSDAQFKECMPELSRPKLLFSDQPQFPVPRKEHEIKLAFARRLLADGMTFGEMATICSVFGQLVTLIMELAAWMRPEQGLVFFSGGGGFRVLFHSPLAWRRVRWGDSPGYAKAFAKSVLAQEVFSNPPMVLEPRLLAGVRAYVDQNVYQLDKGLKPDVAEHFDTGIWPVRVDSNFLSKRVVPNREDPSLSRDIANFWQRVFTEMPAWTDVPIMTGNM